MSRLDHDRVMGILAEAMELPEPHRGGFLDSTCAGEPDLRKKVEELLKFAPAAAEVFDTAANQIVRADPDHIGPYTILEPIGEGGMAVVYKAKQRRPLKRTVAIKLIKLGMDTRQFVARFEAERQALAMMDHPNLAKVFDAGSTESGRPYFVMEYVPGRPILEYCDEHKLGVRQRLELFTAVCEAVEHAHRKGILHRDIKNSNVLVTEVDGKPLPKVIDFGVAKALQQPLTDRTLQTEQGQLIGTPEYMSPEQAERGALDVDTRSDVYSLGVLLYELIAGVQPIPSDVLRSGSYEQVQRIIRETDPPRPSTRLSSLGLEEGTRVAQSRHVPLPTLIRELRSELEWIPLKAMRRDREQRYRSAAELADDIHNYLDGRPLIAGPESGWYRARKFLKRHKTGVAASAAMLLLLIAGILTTTWQAVRATRAETRALEERDNAKATVSFLTRYVLAGATPERIPDAMVREQIISAMITPAANAVGEAFKDRPLIEASVREAIQAALREVGRSDLALPHAEKAWSIRRDVQGADHPQAISALSNYAHVLWYLGRAAEAEPLYQQALERCGRVLGEDHPDSIASLANYAGVLHSMGRPAEAEPVFRQVAESHRRVLGNDHPETITALTNHAATLQSLGRATEAEPLSKEALDRGRRVLGDDHPTTLDALNTYARALESQDRFAEAEPLFKETLERRRRVLGEDHPRTISALNNYASVLQSLGRAGEAEPLFKELLDRKRRLMGEDHPDTILALNNYASVLLSLRRRAEAEPLFKEAHERCRRVLGEDHVNTLTALQNYAQVLVLLGRATEAEPLARRAVAKAIASPSLGPMHPRTKDFASTHARALDALGRHSEAATLLKEFDLPEPTSQPGTRPAVQPAAPPR